jgi:hypothetical protein
MNIKKFILETEKIKLKNGKEKSGRKVLIFLSDIEAVEFVCLWIEPLSLISGDIIKIIIFFWVAISTLLQT